MALWAILARLAGRQPGRRFAPVATSAARLEPRRSRRDLLRSELGRQAHSHPTTTGLSCGGPSGHPRSSRGSALSVGAPRRTTNSAARLEPRRSRRDLLKYTPAGGRIREPTTDESPRPLGRGLSNTPDRIRTCDLRLRRATLYPAELRARAGSGTRTTRTARNKPSSVRRERREDHFSRTGIAAGLQQPTRDSGGAGSSSSPIWPCSRWGLPCDLCYQRPGALLPHPFTLACAPSPEPSAVCFLWHFPSSGRVSAHRRPGVTRHPALRSSDFPPTAPRRPAGDPHSYSLKEAKGKPDAPAG